MPRITLLHKVAAFTGALRLSNSNRRFAVAANWLDELAGFFRASFIVNANPNEASLHYCRVSWETTYGFITPLPVSYSAVSVCELGVMSVQTSRILVCLPLITSS